jgi:hypothetical protein
LSVWESVEQLADFVYRSDHVAFMRRRREWFERFGTSWRWIPAGAIPTVPEAIARLAACQPPNGELSGGCLTGDVC